MHWTALTAAADATALPFSDGAFEAVVCQFGVMFFPQKDTSYREVHRVLAPGGRQLFSVWDSHRYNPFGRIEDETAARFFPADPPQFYTVPFSYYQIDPIKDSLINAGFTDINVAVVGLEKEIPDAARFARGLVHGNPLIDEIRGRGSVDPDRIVDALAQALRQEFGPDPGRMPLQAIIFSASRRQFADGLYHTVGERTLLFVTANPTVEWQRWVIGGGAEGVGR